MDVEQPQGPPAAGNDPPPAWLTTEQVQQAAAQAAVQHAAQIQSHAQLQAQTAQMRAPAAGHAMHAAQATQAAGPTPMPYGLPSPMGAASGVWVPVMMAPEPALQPVPTAMTPAAPPAPPSMPPAPAALSAPAGLARDGTARRQEVEELLVSARVALRDAVKVLFSHGREAAIQRADEQKKRAARSPAAAAPANATGHTPHAPAAAPSFAGGGGDVCGVSPVVMMPSGYGFAPVQTMTNGGTVQPPSAVGAAP